MNLRAHRNAPGRVRVVAVGAAVLVMMGLFPAVAGAESLGGAASSILRREPQLTPAQLGNNGLGGLQYANPAEGIDLIKPPVASNQGNAALDLPLGIPQGRGIQPDLTLHYDSGGGNGWLGMGWDLNVGEITVDTRWGVPRYSDQYETETYLLDGAQLSPTANTSDSFAPRVPGDRADFTRRVDNQYDLIIRHGDTPADYWWEVFTKMGGIKWYGGFPDKGGPTGAYVVDDPDSDDPADVIMVPGLGGSQDKSAILYADEGQQHPYRWALSAERDVGVNEIRYYYEQVPGHRVGADSQTVGKQLYLTRIHYTAAAQVGARPLPRLEGDDLIDPSEDAAYQIDFLRDTTSRRDVIVDGRGGFLQVTSDLLKRVEVHYGEPRSTVDIPHPELRRNYNILSKAFDFNYGEGAFGKTLLRSVDQRGSDNVVFASNTFSYFDDVRDGDGGYNGFAGRDKWTSGSDIPNEILGPFAADFSSLGSSRSISADGHIYLGFNPVIGSKELSAGGSISISGGVTEAMSEFIDINGDQLPDKVYRHAPGGTVFYRLNQSGPRGITAFGGEHEVVDLPGLSSEADVGVSGAVEAYVVAEVQFSIGANVTTGVEYFTDVNNDGLIDFIRGGSVYFNHLDGPDHTPSFRRSSDDTAVPVGMNAPTLPNIAKLDEIEQQQRDRSPLQDTVRRWIAPFTGVVSINAPVTYEPPPDTAIPRDSAPLDGVRVTIQTGPAELWATVLTTPNQIATPSGLNALPVIRGQAIYFRSQSVDDGRRDQVRWDPTITYTSVFGAGAPITAPDANGLSPTIYKASRDFAIAGRPNTKILMPLQGTVRFDAKLKKAATTDDVRVLVFKNGVVVIDRLISADTVSATGVDVSGTFDVAAPVGDDADEVIVRIAVDSPIDLQAIEWTPRLYYLSAVHDGRPVPVVDNRGQYTLQLKTPFDTDIYPFNTLGEPRGAWVSPVTGRASVEATAVIGGPPDIGDVVATVKAPAKLAGKGTFQMTPLGMGGIGDPPTSAGSVEFEIDLVAGQPYWFDLSTRSSQLGRFIRWEFEVTYGSGDDRRTEEVPSAANAAGEQGIFPIPYRGWAVAGYNGDGPRATAPIDPEAFVFHREDYPDDDESPSGFHDGSYKDPTKGRSYPFIPFLFDVVDGSGNVTGSRPAWRGAKDNLVVGLDYQSSSRTGIDNPNVVQPASAAPSGSGTKSAVPRVGVTGPTLSVVAGVLGATVAFGLAPSFGLVDYMDLNGDSFPDVLTPGSVEYTGPRGGFIASGGGDGAINQDFTFSVGAGFGGSPVGIKGNAQGEANNTKNAAPNSKKGKTQGSTSQANKGDPANKADYGFDIGAAFGLGAQFTNVTASALESVLDEAGMDFGDGMDIIGGFDWKLEEDYADVNGDGLPDRIEVEADGDIQVRLNLGYGFASPIKWAEGGLETGVEFSGEVEGLLGFQIFNKSYAGGLSYTESFEFPKYSWVDLNGDGILDRLESKMSGGVKAHFGSGAGVLGEEVDYGDFEEGEVDVISTGETVAQGRSRGIGAGFDFTIGIGPLCTLLCYIIINPGAHFGVSSSSTQVDLIDVNGDGYPDSVSSDRDDEIHVRLNNRGRTNLLRSTKNALGGEIRLDYRRDGNTVEQPFSQWVLASVDVDDNRDGDGANHRLTTYEYSGNQYNRLEREMLGYTQVIERQREFRNDGNVNDDPLLRSIERNYRNGTIYENGLVTSEVIKAPNGKPLKETRTDWKFVDQYAHGDISLTLMAGDPGLGLLGKSIAPLRTKIEQRWYNTDGDLGQQTWSTFDYDDLGNVARLVDVGEPEDNTDDVTAITTYSSCPDSASLDLQAAFPCPAPRPETTQLSPLWGPLRCPTWTSIPATFQVLDSQNNVLRERNGAPALCDNSSVTHQVESGGNGQFSITDLSYDEWGSYNHIVYPANADGERLRIDYVYEETSHGRIGTTRRSVCMAVPPDAEEDPCSADFDPDPNGDTAVAVFDGKTGRIASRTDANGQKTTYTYDEAGRIKTITGPYQQPNGPATVTFDYHPREAAYGYAIAHHYDAFHSSSDPIDTVTFVDGVGRTTQTKQDATVRRAGAQTASDMMIVHGPSELDSMGRVVKAWYPAVEPLGTAGRFNPDHTSVGPTVTTLDLLDRATLVVNPNLTTVKSAYGFGGQSDFGAMLFATTVTDELGKPQTSYTDVRDKVRAADDLPLTAPKIRTRYTYDGLGQLTEVVDNGGNKTTHTYDRLGRRTSTSTPDGGLVEMRFDPASNLVARIDPNLRAEGTQVTYRYDAERLVAVDYPAATPDVTYVWGDHTAAGNGIGRVVALLDGARDQKFTYDPLGAVATETSTMLVHNLNDAVGQKVTYTTSSTYDTWGRLRTLTYPDGEVLTNDYDSGGLLKNVVGRKGPFDYRYVDRLEYDEFVDRRFQKVGNGVETVYNYDPETRRLSRQTTNTPVREIQDFNYSYDDVGNLKKADNQMPAPVSSLYGGPGVQTFEYDPYYRLSSAKGTYNFAPNKVRDYTYQTSYDVNGNITGKKQTDTINGKLEQKPTTYDLSMTYRTDKPHQLTKIGTHSHTYDRNGNFTGWADTKTGARRTVTWTAADRVASVADQGSTTTYKYDSAGQLGIERGPGGETAFVNQWYTVRNGSVPWKHVWAGDDRVATKRSFSDGTLEHMRYLLHKDLQGSTNMVTDDKALTFQHLEYFPGGEIWVHDKSDVHRTPYLYTGGYFDEVRNIVDLGARWYEPREQFMYSSDPVLQDSPDRVVGDPALLPAYTYAESNPLGLVDLDGRSPTFARLLFTALRHKGVDQTLRNVAIKAMQPPGTSVWGGLPIEAAPTVAGDADSGGGTASRLWRWATFADEKSKRGKLQAMQDRYTAKAFLEVEMVKTDKGWTVDEASIAPTLTSLGQFKVFSRAKADANSGGGGGKAPAHSKQLVVHKSKPGPQ